MNQKVISPSSLMMIILDMPEMLTVILRPLPTEVIRFISDTGVETGTSSQQKILTVSTP